MLPQHISQNDAGECIAAAFPAVIERAGSNFRIRASGSSWFYLI